MSAPCPICGDTVPDVEQHLARTNASRGLTFRDMLRMLHPPKLAYWNGTTRQWIAINFEKNDTTTHDEKTHDDEGR